MAEEIEALLVEQLKEAHSAERQSLKAMPRLAKQATSPALRAALEAHVAETEAQVERLERALGLLGARTGRKGCEGMRGLIEEAQAHVKAHRKGPLADVVIVAVQQRVEHYEIACYGTMAALAKSAGAREVASLLAQTLKEEERTDEKLSRLAEREVNPAAGGKRPRGAAAGAKAAPKARGGGRAAPAKAKAPRGRRAKDGGGSGTSVTTDHDEIRRWAEAKGGRPAAVESTHEGGDVGIIRLMFPDSPRSEHEALVEIPWEEFFEKFEESRLALLHGEDSLFSKLVGRDTVERRARGGGDARRASGGRAPARRGATGQRRQAR